MLLRQQSTIPYLPCYLRAPIGCAYFNEHGRCCDRDGHNSHAHRNMPFTFLSRRLYVQCHSCICWQFLSQTHSHLLLVFTSGPFLAPRSLSRSCVYLVTCAPLSLIGIGATLLDERPVGMRACGPVSSAFFRPRPHCRRIRRCGPILWYNCLGMDNPSSIHNVPRPPRRSAMSAQTRHGALLRRAEELR